MSGLAVVKIINVNSPVIGHDLLLLPVPSHLFYYKLEIVEEVWDKSL